MLISSMVELLMFYYCTRQKSFCQGFCLDLVLLLQVSYTYPPANTPSNISAIQPNVNSGVMCYPLGNNKGSIKSINTNAQKFSVSLSTFSSNLMILYAAPSMYFCIVGSSVVLFATCFALVCISSSDWPNIFFLLVKLDAKLLYLCVLLDCILASYCCNEDSNMKKLQYCQVHSHTHHLVHIDL